MTGKFIRPGVVALGLLGGAAAVGAEPPAAPPEPGKHRQIIRWPGGWMYLDGPDVIVRQTSPSASTNLITGSANGVGNRIVVDNGDSPGVTVLKNVRNGVGNSVTVTPAGPVFDLPGRPAVEYHGRATKFWTKTVHSEVLGCDLYWCPQTRWWFRYDQAADVYRPIAAAVAPAAEKK